MNKRGVIILGLFLITLMLTTVVFGSDIFLFDLEKNKVLMMGTDETGFKEKFSLEKVPDLVMGTYSPDFYLAIYMPKSLGEEASDSSWRPIQEAPDKSSIKNGQLMLVNVASGRTDDLVDIGFPPFRTGLSKDKKHLLVSCRTEANGGNYELLHYDIVAKKMEKIDQLQAVNDIEFATDSNSAFAIIEKSGEFDLATLTFGPFAVKQTIPAGRYPSSVYALNEKRIALIDTASKERLSSEEAEKVKAFVKLIDTEKNEVIQETQFKPAHIWLRWFKEQRTLFLQTFDRDKTHYIKVNGEGIYSVDTDIGFVYEYVPEKDTVYELTKNRLEIRDFKNNSESTIKTGLNWCFYSDGDVSFYLLDILPEMNLAVVYSIFFGKVHFYDLNTNTLIKTVNGSPIKEKFRPDFNMKTVVTTNQEKTRVYILNRVKKGVAVFNEKLDQIATLEVESEQPIGMYQIKKPTLQTILVTEKALYKIEDDKLKTICSFPEKVKEAYMLQDEKRLIFFINDYWYIVDPVTYELKYRLNEFGDPNDKYTKVQKGQRRYYFVPTLNDWSE